MQARDFGDLLKRTSGLDALSLGWPTVEQALQQRLQACQMDSLGAYWERIQVDAQELHALIEAVVVPETWFFRNAEALQVMASRVQAAGPSATQPALLMSLPCSTGEEPYSMAIALLEAGVSADAFRIDAVDISQQALRRAEAGRYGEYSFRGAAPFLRERYFREQNDGWCIDPQLRESVRFHQSNMLDSAMHRFERHDVIFCRNLLIYFDTSTQHQAVTVLGRLLKPDGLLFVGPAEAGVLLKHGWLSQRVPHAFAFRQPDSSSGASHQTPPASAPPRPPRAPAPRRDPPAVVSRPPADRRQQVQPIAHDGAPAGALLYSAQKLADEGHLAEAEEVVEQYLRHYGPLAGAYYLLGLVNDASGQLTLAEAHYRKALYLEPQHQQALVHLAMLLEARGQYVEARRLHQRARRLDNPDTE